jgi:hypothetical protein
MANIAANNVFIFGDQTISTTPVTPTKDWKDRLAGTAFVESSPMEGFVLAISLRGPTVVGISNIDAGDGSWEITNIGQQYDGEDLIVLGISRDTNNNYAVASRVKTV